MCDERKIFVRACSDRCTFAEALYAALDAEGITYSSECIECAKAALISVPAKGMIASCTVADVVTAIGAGVPVIPVFEDTVEEAVSKIKALAGDAADEEHVIEESAVEESAVEEPVIEEPVIEEPVIEEPVVEEPVIEEPVVEIPANTAHKCANCGADIIPDTKFCYGCGSKIEPAKVETSEPVKEKMAVCPECGAEILPNTKFCYGCGRKLEEEHVPVEEVKPVCSGCGADIVPGTKFCFKCGTRHDTAEQVQTPAVPVTPKCPGCGADIVAGDKFCFSCGRAL